MKRHRFNASGLYYETPYGQSCVVFSPAKARWPAIWRIPEAVGISFL